MIVMTMGTVARLAQQLGYRRPAQARRGSFDGTDRVNSRVARWCPNFPLSFGFRKFGCPENYSYWRQKRRNQAVRAPFLVTNRANTKFQMTNCAIAKLNRKRILPHANSGVIIGRPLVGNFSLLLDHPR
jgi:hypothetical protein